MPQGKCSKCNLLYAWDGSPQLAAAVCYKCGGSLERTTYLSKLPHAIRPALRKKVTTLLDNPTGGAS